MEGLLKKDSTLHTLLRGPCAFVSERQFKYIDEMDIDSRKANVKPLVQKIDGAFPSSYEH